MSVYKTRNQIKSQKQKQKSKGHLVLLVFVTTSRLCSLIKKIDTDAAMPRASVVMNSS